MIKRISINNVASYKSPAILETDKPINLIYGLNGSGKTTISNLLQNQDKSEFNNCSIEGFDSEQQEIVVYNQNFISENFYNSVTQKGIFTLGKNSKEILEMIEHEEEVLKILQNELNNQESGLIQREGKNTESKNNLRNNTENKIWEIKSEFTGGDRIFDKAKFLDGLKGSKKILFDHIKNIPYIKTERQIDDIKKDLQELNRNRNVNLDERELIQTISGDELSRIEQNSIFMEEIIGNQNSTVASLISKLGNSDWVRHGLKYLPSENSNTCPFCQQETLTKKLQEEIKNYFNDTYVEKIQQLTRLLNDYQSPSIDYASIDFFFPNSDVFQHNKLIAELKSIIKENESIIRNKIKEPSQPVTLNETKSKIHEINNFIRAKNQEIQEINEKIKNRNSIIQSLKNEFWQILRCKYEPVISLFNDRYRELSDEETEIKKRIQMKKIEMNEKLEIISKLKENITNIQETINNINENLESIGMQDVKIVEHDENNYRIERLSDSQEKVFETLSEGEKSMISFLYFIELCKGSLDSNSVKKKIIVIDDPISSLSHVYVFNVAQLIKQNILDKLVNNQNIEYLQCFILTHNSYFFHELCRISKNKRKNFRISKSNCQSHIEVMQENEIINDYEVYWDIVKNVDQANQRDIAIVANSMRNIIEHFCGFLHKGKEFIKLNEILNEPKFQAFNRYMERESHSDQTNISDYKEFDISIFQSAFKQFFIELGQEEHYNKYMNID